MWIRSRADVGKVLGRCGKLLSRRGLGRKQASVNKPGDRAARTEHHSRAGLVVSLFVILGICGTLFSLRSAM